MTERPDGVELHRPVPDDPPETPDIKRPLRIALPAVLGGLTLLAVVALNTNGWVHGWRFALYAIPAVLLGTAAAELLRRAERA